MKKVFLVVLFAVGILAAAWRFWPETKTAPTEQLTGAVSTTTGDLRGFVQDGLNVYLGIPYGEAPSGQRRFKAPEPRRRWDGVFDAFAFGPVCPQVYDSIELDDPNEKTDNEDCLTLNVWAPAGGGDHKAVMVFIHGGGFVAGSSKSRLYHGDSLAKTGDVVVVSLNYRVGLPGFLDFSAIGGPDYADSANNGLKDQLLALQWVQDNIAALGGDPQNVTVFGESAGGSSVAALLGIEQPQRYFRRAIIMSGSPHHSAATSAAIAALIRDETGLAAPLLWKTLPAAAINYINGQLYDAIGSPMSDLLFAPTYGPGNVMKRPALEAAQQGLTKGIDLMIGTMGNEISYWSFYDTPDEQICDQTAAENIVTAIDPGQAAQIRALYDLYRQNPERSDYREGEVILNIEDDYIFRTPALQLAEAQSQNGRTYVYRAEYPVNLPEQDCQDNRAPHGSDLPFVFGKSGEKAGTDFLGLPENDQDTVVRQRLEQQMIAAWTNFAKTGDPNGPGLPEWPLFQPGSQPIMGFGIETRVENAPFYQEYQAMLEYMQVFNLFDIFK